MDLIADPRAPQRVRHETRRRLLDVVGVSDITPTMRRITLKGDMDGFASPGHADHIKVFIFPAGVAPHLPPEGGEFAAAERPQMRDYTPRAWDVDKGTLDIDFVLHGDGPASGWAAQAKIGQKLLIGDETAIPALARRIAELPAQARVLAIVEVDNVSEHQPFPGEADVSLTYVYRNGAAPGSTSLMLDRLKVTSFPAGTAFAYVAGEAVMSKAVRAHLTDARGFNPEYVKAAGYWALGVADAKGEH